MFLRRQGSTALFSVCLLVTFLAGCGGGQSSNSTSASTSPTAPSGSSAPPSSGGSGSTSGSGSSGSSGGGTGGSTGGSEATEFATILVNGSSQNGTLTVDANGTDGKGQVQLTGGDRNFNYQLNFCSFRSSNCVNAGNVNTDASGAATTNFQFPGTGVWSGNFTISAPGNQNSFETTFPAPPQTGQYISALQRASTVADVAQMNLGTPGSDPLTSGQLTVTPNPGNPAGSQTSLKFILSGAAPNQTYLAGFCSGPASTCFAITGQISTDSSGNVTTTLPYTNFNPSGVFYLSRDGDAAGTLEFIVGFKVQ